MANNEKIIKAFEPIRSRVRIDRIARKPRNRNSYWSKNEELTDGKLIEHYSGGVAVGVCPIKNGEETTKLALFDLDSHKGELEQVEMRIVAYSLCDELRKHGLEPRAFLSSGGRGIHIYIIWDSPQDAYSVRYLLSKILKYLGYRNGTGGVIKKEIEVFPKQDSVPVGGCGNQFILPMAGKSLPLDMNENLKVRDKDFFLDLDWEPSNDVPIEEKPKPQKRRDYNFESLDKKLKEIESMISYIDPTDRDEWIMVGMGIHYESNGSEEGKDLWDSWSSNAASYEGYDDITKTWESFKHYE